jgi:hypothetical protein
MRSGEERRGVRNEEWGIPTVMLGQSEQAETMMTLTKRRASRWVILAAVLMLSL